ncbi:MAG TPA: hypothetical protein VE709_10920 [Pseudonocardiaceae bacterium]|jgi:hypothetical protein|nr:hypothetical protein [Pseudonocardiaceae bacterium]
MSTERLSPSQADRLATLLDALGGIPVSEAERWSLIHLAGDEVGTVENIAGLIRRAGERSALNVLRTIGTDIAALAREVAQHDQDLARRIRGGAR